MNHPFWIPSDEQRQNILLLEALGLIHDLGKLSDTFLKSQEPSSNIKYSHNLLADPRQIIIYQNYQAKPQDMATKAVQQWLSDASSVHCAFGERTDITALLEKIQFTDWVDQVYNFAELMPFVARPGLAKATANWQEVLGKEMLPGLLVGRLHGPAHIEKEGQPNQNKQPYSDVFRATPFGLEERIGTDATKESTNALNSLPLADIEQIKTNQRGKWLNMMKAQMSRGLADNRRPHNEVSLWDWGYTVASMTKAAAAWIFKNGWPATLEDLPYRTLRINLDILSCYTRSDKISDLLGVHKALYDAFGRVQTLLEETYALGNQLYHDETGAYYLLPDLNSAGEIDELRQKIQSQFPADLLPQVYLCERVTASQLDVRSSSHDPDAVRRLIAEPRAQALREAPVCADNNLYLFETEWAEGRPENAETCMVCGVRPVGYPRQGSVPEEEHRLNDWATQEKAEARNVCRVCLDRRGRRAEKWATDELQGTIWTEEVSDDNGRLALFVGKLGLEGWLDGSLLSTIQVTKNGNLKIPSPARLYRIIETARAFWQQIIDDITPKIVGQRPLRLSLYPPENNLPDLGDYHAYELEVDGLALNVVWDKNGRFLTAENLAYFAKRWETTEAELAGRLQDRTFDVLEPSAFQRPGLPLFKVQIDRVESLDGYQPTIPLLTEPEVCMSLIPADTALDFVKTVKQEYEKQMGKVRDRLPLYVGLVFCRRRTPIHTVLEAGRAMLDMAGNTQWEGWRLVSNNSPTSGECELAFDNNIIWHVPVLVGDSTTKDEWYPRMYEGDSKEVAQVKHVLDLRVRRPEMSPEQGWKVWVRPSRFDFQVLDTTGRRFEIHYDPEGRRPRRTRPYYLEDLDRLENLWDLMKSLDVSQRLQVIHTIETTREMWYGQDYGNHASEDEVFRQFVAVTLAGATWPKDKPWKSIQTEWQEKLIVAGVSGELADLAELNVEILKE
jgi:hypothetical protein